MQPKEVIEKIARVLTAIVFYVCVAIIILAGMVIMTLLMLGGKYVYYNYDKRDSGHALHIKLGNETSKGSRTKARGKVK